MTDKKRAVDAEETRGDARAKKPKGSTTKSDAARRIQPGTRALDDGRRACVVIAWNIAGLRSFYDKSLERLEALVREEDPDVVVMQEHKLQAAHAGTFTEKLRERFPRHSCVRFAVSTVKKGYSGAVSYTHLTLPTTPYV